VVGSADRILFGAGISQTDLTFVRSVNGTGNDLIVSINGTPDQIFINSDLWADTNNRSQDGDRIEYFDFADGSRLTISDIEAKTLIGTVGNESLKGFLSSNDLIDSKGGNDSLSGLSGDDTYLFGRGYGVDTILDHNGDGVVGSADRVLFGAGITQNDLTFARSGTGGTDLLISIKGTTDQLIISAGLWADTNNRVQDGDRIEYFDFADGSRLSISDIEAKTLIGTVANETIKGYLTDDILMGNAGNDTLTGGNGNDTYIFNVGDGQDTILEGGSSGAGGNDTLQFGGGISTANLMVSKDATGNDLILSIAGGSDKVTIKNDITSASDNRLEQVRFSDGTILTHAQLLALIPANVVAPSETNNAPVLDHQLSQLVQAMASYSAADPGFDPEFSAVHSLSNDLGLHSALAAVGHI
jgi:Ca2+-binding RTX toxin-like protein